MSEGFPATLQAEIDVPREACGVVAMLSADPGDLAQRSFNALCKLQNRGEDGAGLYLLDHGQFIGEKGAGLVRDAIIAKGIILDSRAPDSAVAIGHVRYGTAGNPKDKGDCVQPFLGPGFALAHNGHLEWLSEVTARYGLPPGQSISDSEGLTQLIAHVRATKAQDPTEADPMFAALEELLPQLEGGCSATVAEPDRIFAISDYQGFRPLFIGSLPEGGYMFASEEPAIRAAGGVVLREVERGEIVAATINGGLVSRKIDTSNIPSARCALEYSYFMKKHGTWGGRSISGSRMEMGRLLAVEAPVEADVVIGVPDSGTSAALGFAEALGIPYREGLVRDPHASGRSFIQAKKSKREAVVLEKLSADREHLQDKRVVIVDDTVVRGTNMSTLIRLVREAGATKVHVRIPCPPIKDPCVYGIDIGDPTTLLARQCMREDGSIDTAEMARLLDADSIEFLSPQGLDQAINLAVGSSLCKACMTGEYPTRTPERASTFLGTPVMRQSSMLARTTADF